VHRPGNPHIPNVLKGYADGKIRNSVTVKISSGDTAATALRRAPLIVSFGFAGRVGETITRIGSMLVTLI
jgi:hypothetical protein